MIKFIFSKHLLKVNLYVVLTCSVCYAKEGNTKFSSDVAFLAEAVVENTCVKDQGKTNACWSFSTVSLLESELLRQSSSEIDLSEMFFVYHSYLNKAKKYVRLHGNLVFTGGGLSNDVLDVIKKIGCVPESAYPWKDFPDMQHAHFKMEEELRNFLDNIVHNSSGIIDQYWEKDCKKILNKYLGEVPTKFQFQGKTYTPKSFAEELSIRTDDYIFLSSFSHHPYYKNFILEVPDNWSWGKVMNISLDELVTVTDFALENGYSLSLAMDITEKGFNYNEGIASMQELVFTENFDQFPNSFKEIEKKRQQAFDNYETTDDHAMHLIGKSRNKSGDAFYLLKNSWGNTNKYYGYMYISDDYYKYKTISVVVHKDAIPKKIIRKFENEISDGM